MGRYELTDSEWKAIEPCLPNKPRGVPRVNDRRVLNGIFWVLRSGARWADLPERLQSAQLSSPTRLLTVFGEPVAESAVALVSSIISVASRAASIRGTAEK